MSDQRLFRLYSDFYTLRPYFSLSFDSAAKFAENSPITAQTVSKSPPTRRRTRLFSSVSHSMTPTSSAALQTAALPFILPWKGLVQGLDVVSLGPAPEGWKRLLAGQGIALRESSRDAVPQGYQVASGFDRLDGLTESDLAAWAKAALEALTPGGILVLGGTEPEMAPAGQAALSALRAAHLLEAEGFARTRVLSPAAPFYAVVVQAPARGAAFDVFSPVFLATPPPAESTALARSEAALHQRLQQLEHHQFWKPSEMYWPETFAA